MNAMTPRQARRMAEMKQEDMARLLRMSRRAYQEKEASPGRFTVEEARQFCKVTETTMEQVFGGKA